MRHPDQQVVVELVLISGVNDDSRVEGGGQHDWLARKRMDVIAFYEFLRPPPRLQQFDHHHRYHHHHRHLEVERQK